MSVHSCFDYFSLYAALQNMILAGKYFTDLNVLCNLVYFVQAHEQLRAVLITLLEELPSDLPILLLGTTLVPLDEPAENSFSIFPRDNV